MIRALQTEDISAVSAIWLNTNLSAHAFIPSQYWEGQLSEVTEALAQAEVYLCEGHLLAYIAIVLSDSGSLSVSVVG